MQLILPHNTAYACNPNVDNFLTKSQLTLRTLQIKFTLLTSTSSRYYNSPSLHRPPLFWIREPRWPLALHLLLHLVRLFLHLLSLIVSFSWAENPSQNPPCFVLVTCSSVINGIVLVLVIVDACPHRLREPLVAGDSVAVWSYTLWYEGRAVWPSKPNGRASHQPETPCGFHIFLSLVGLLLLLFKAEIGLVFLVAWGVVSLWE